MALTFKKHPKITGLSGVGYPNQGSDIKWNGKVIGNISAPNWKTDDYWYIRLAIVKKNILEDGNPNCAWHMITLNLKFNSDADARTFLRANIQRLLDRYNFHNLSD